MRTGDSLVALVMRPLLMCAGCSIRYDATGVSRVGVGLWGFGDPPGVNWNLDGPRRGVSRIARDVRAPSCRRAAMRRDWQSRDEQRTAAAHPTFIEPDRIADRG